MSTSVNKESRVEGRLLKYLHWIHSLFALMSSPKRVKVWCTARALCSAEKLAAVLQPQKAAEKADSLTTYI